MDSLPTLGTYAGAVVVQFVFFDVLVDMPVVLVIVVASIYCTS